MDLRIFSRSPRQALVLAILLTSVLNVRCRPPGPDALPVNGDKPLWQFTDADLEAYLRDLHAREPDLRRRVVEIARRTIGQPYKLGPLGEGGAEPYDPDPLYCLTASDCVTFVEQTWAMALSRDKAEFLDTLRRIRYREGRIGLLTRNHFTEADWNVNNAWLFESTTAALGGASVRAYKLTINRRTFFEKYGLNTDAPVQQWSDEYIPVASLERVLPVLADADVIEFVKNEKSPFVGHLGLITHDANGTVMLLHSGEPAVQELPLMDYLKRHPTIVGVKALRAR